MTPQSEYAVKDAHESRDADAIGVGLIVLLVMLTTSLSFLTAWGLLHLLQRGRNPKATQQNVIRELAEFPQPRLEIHPAADLEASRKPIEARLHSYGWVDRDARVAHIPIERAMQLTLARGLPEVGAGQTRLQLMQARPSETIPPNEQRTLSSPTATPG